MDNLCVCAWCVDVADLHTTDTMQKYLSTCMCLCMRVYGADDPDMKIHMVCSSHLCIMVCMYTCMCNCVSWYICVVAGKNVA